MAKSKKSASEPALGYEAQLWKMADAKRSLVRLLLSTFRSGQYRS